MSKKSIAFPLLALIGGFGCVVPLAGHASTLPAVPTFYSTTIQQPHYPNFWAVGETATLTSNSWKLLGTTYTDYELTVSAPASAIFDNNSAYYKVNDPTVQIHAYFDPYGHLISSYGGQLFFNTYSIYGQGNRGGTPVLPASSNPTAGTPPANSTSWSTVYSNTLDCPGSPCLLFGALLTSVGVDTTHNGTVQHDALGFGTALFSGWANRPWSYLPESLWLFLNNDGSAYSNTEITSNTAWDNFLAEIQSHSTSTPLTSFTISGEVTSIATVPLPGSVWFLGAAFGGLVLLRRQRQRRTPGVYA
ncbi:MAG: VPLPA-CTERM sorting domain-containing protein [Nevskia sp.]|nr:VPLPA-CTERM sorting domain-containing protein [Nevskia sp.]